MDKEIGELLIQQFQGRDSLEEIQQTLEGLFELRPSSSVCSSLFIPILQHAQHNVEVEISMDMYSNIIFDIFHYTIQHFGIEKESVFDQCIILIKDIMAVLDEETVNKTKYGFNLSDIDLNDLLSLWTIPMLVCHKIIVVHKADIYGTTAFSSLWAILPGAFHRCIVLPLINPKTIPTLRAMCILLVQYFPEPSYSLHAEKLLNTLLPFLYDPSDSQQNTANAISFVTETFPDLELINPSFLSHATNAAAEYAKTKDIHPARQRALLNLSCLLLNNDQLAPWLNETIAKSGPELDVLIQKAKLLSGMDGSEKSENMDIDQSQGQKVNQTLRNRCTELIEELSFLETNDPKCNTILSEIHNLLIYTNNTNLSSICQSHVRKITEFTTKMLIVDPSIAESVANLFDTTIPQFITKYIHYALSYAILDPHNCEDLLMGVTSALEITEEQLFEQYSHYIMLALLLENNTEVKCIGYNNLKRLHISQRDFAKHLAIKNATRITTELCMNLGVPRLKQQSFQALQEMKDLAGNLAEPISSFVSRYIVGILDRVTRFIFEKRSNSLIVHDPNAIQALKEYMEIVQPDIKNHALLLMKTFRAINGLNNMQVEALTLWKKLISLLDERYTISNLNGIVAGLLDLFPLSDVRVRTSTAMTLENLISRKIPLVSSPTELPFLPDFPELASAKKNVTRTFSRRSFDSQTLEHIMHNLKSPDDVQILFELQKLDMYLSEEFSVQLPPAVYSQLLYILRKYPTHEEIPRLAAICLGKMGAINPSLVDVKTIEDNVFIMKNFVNEAENREFICALILNHIYPAYNATSDEQAHQYMQLSLQSLLKCAGFRDMSTRPEAERRPLLDRWKKFPPAIKEFLSPFLISSFESKWRGDDVLYPIFPQATSFGEWTEKWFCKLVSAFRGKAKSIFEACVPIAMSSNIEITTFLIPYAVLHTIALGTGLDVNSILDEMLLIVDINAQYAHNAESEKLNRQCLQVVVSITEYCRKWLNNVTDRSTDSAVKRISDFLKKIPERDMAISAFNSDAYPQALMHFETYLKSLPDAQSTDAQVLNYLRQIYTELNNPTDLLALMERFFTSLSQDAEIIRFETAGRWQEAEVLYKNRTVRNNFDIVSYAGYFNCLKKWGSYESVLYVADKIPSKIEKKYKAKVNAYRIDSAWRVEDWHTLERATKMPVEKTPEAFIGLIISKMREGKDLEVACLIEDARKMLVEKLTSNRSESYRKSYPTIFNLQLLQELEEAQKTWETADPTHRIRSLMKKWEEKDKTIASDYQYKHNLLEVRKAAYFDIRPETNTKPLAAQLLIKIAKSSRKAGNLSAALDAIITAENMAGESFYNEKAKWYWARGYKQNAIDILKTMNKGNRDGFQVKDALLMTKFQRLDPKVLRMNELRDYHAAAVKRGKKIEKAHYNAILFYSTHNEATALSISKIKMLQFIVKSCINALQVGSKYYYSTMPKLINTWFDIAALDRNLKPTDQSELAKTIRKGLEVTTMGMRDVLKTVSPFMFTSFLPRLISHLTIDNEKVAECLIQLISDVFAASPRSSIWFLMGDSFSQGSLASKRVQMVLDRAIETHKGSEIPTIINHAKLLLRALRQLSNLKVGDRETFLDLDSMRGVELTNIKNINIHIPTEKSLYPVLPEVIEPGVTKFNCSVEKYPTIARISSKVVVMKSLQKPKQITIIGSDGKEYKFLVKAEDDLRKDARTMELNYAINSFLRKTPESRDNDLYIRTYAVIPLGDKWGLIQWIENIASLKAIINDLLPKDSRKINELMAVFAGKAGMDKDKDPFVRYKAVLAEHSPVFFKWFLNHFPEPNQWLTSRSRYIKTLAVMSIVGYMIGLGDRHAENLLFDETNGDCVHVDLNMLFDKGKDLNVPELVPFRLTQNLVDAMGILGYHGTFTKTCEITLTVMLQNKEALISVFETLINSGTHKTKDSLKKTVNRFDLKLDQVDRTVKTLIANATSEENLSKMFYGWSPFV